MKVIRNLMVLLSFSCSLGLMAETLSPGFSAPPAAQPVYAPVPAPLAPAPVQVVERAPAPVQTVVVTPVRVRVRRPLGLGIAGSAIRFGLRTAHDAVRFGLGVAQSAVDGDYYPYGDTYVYGPY